ncbi:MAG: hypothetical protein M4579_006608 [Chaenotheca gracillima]|nr:MAG: hypothetical protein M4579_006608 [Chaenotheca gracillima]
MIETWEDADIKRWYRLIKEGWLATSKRSSPAELNAVQGPALRPKKAKPSTVAPEGHESKKPSESEIDPEGEEIFGYDGLRFFADMIEQYRNNRPWSSMLAEEAPPDLEPGSPAALFAPVLGQYNKLTK